MFSLFWIEAVSVLVENQTQEIYLKGFWGKCCEMTSENDV